MQVDERIGRRLRLRDLNMLMIVVRERSISKAAAQLAVSQPVVSKTIADMEHMLGVPLLDRNRRGVEPTIYGQALIRRGFVVFDELRQSVKDIENLLDPTVSEARIGSTQTLTMGIVPAIIETLIRQQPRSSFHVVEGDLVSLQRELRDRTVELVIGRAPTPVVDEDMQSEILFDDRLLVVAGVRNKWSRQKKIKITDLLDEHWICPPLGTVPGSLVSDAFRGAGVKMPRASVSSLSLGLHAFLLNTGRFLALFPESTIRFSSQRFPHKVLPVDFWGEPRPVVIVTMKGRTLSPAAQRFIECARAIIKPLAPGR
jgi:DNA-binding transcriptional LysR family regulator